MRGKIEKIHQAVKLNRELGSLRSSFIQLSLHTIAIAYMKEETHL